jgi:rubrerythrin
MGIFGPGFQEKGQAMAAKGRESIDQGVDDYVRFCAAGESGKGEYRCSECAYAVTVCRALPVCPRCGGSSWEQVAWSPLSRALRLQ